jgi:hypothetical protein
MLPTLPTSVMKVTTPSLVPSPSCIGRFVADNILIINQPHHIGPARDGLALETLVTSVREVRGRCFCRVPHLRVEIKNVSILRTAEMSGNQDTKPMEPSRKTFLVSGKKWNPSIRNSMPMSEGNFTFNILW